MTFLFFGDTVFPRRFAPIFTKQCRKNFQKRFKIPAPCSVGRKSSQKTVLSGVLLLYVLFCLATSNLFKELKRHIAKKYSVTGTANFDTVLPITVKEKSRSSYIINSLKTLSCYCILNYHQQKPIRGLVYH